MGAPVSLNFRFHAPGEVAEALEGAAFAVTERAEGEPYEDVEYATRRCYLFARVV